MSTDLMPIMEGFIQILIAVVIFITILRRGKNRLLSALGVLFVILGIFTFLPYLSDSVKKLPIISLFVDYASIIGNIAIFFGVATYTSFQFGILKVNKIVRTAFIIGFFIAFSLVFVHFLTLDTVNVDFSYKIVYSQMSRWLTYIFFLISLGFITIIFVSLGWQLRKEKGAMDYITTTGLGLGLMLVAVVMRRALDLFSTPINHVIIDVLSLVSLGFVIIGAMFQTSFSMSPGFIYDARSKHPIALALIRIFRSSDDKLLESRITKADGHYGLLLEPGEYKIDVSAKGYNFPSKIGTYRGESFRIHKPTVLALDIALDPTE